MEVTDREMRVEREKRNDFDAILLSHIIIIVYIVIQQYIHSLLLHSLETNHLEL